MKKKYSAQGHISNTDAQIIGELIDGKFKGRITPQQLLKEAQLKTSPIHHMFDWDDSKAAREWRLHQARQLIISVFVEADDDKPIRSFMRVNIGTGSIYLVCDKVRESPDLMDQVTTSAKEQLLRWQDRYSRYCEFFEFNFSMKGQKHVIKGKENRRKAVINTGGKPQNRAANNRRDQPSAG